MTVSYHGHYKRTELNFQNRSNFSSRHSQPSLILNTALQKQCWQGSTSATREIYMSSRSTTPKTLCFSEPKCLGVTLDRSLTYLQHLESLRKNLTSCIALFKQIAGSGWGAGATTLWTVTLALVHSTAEYCAPVWCCSAHTWFTHPAINDTLWIVIECLHSTPRDNLPILAGIQPAKFCCKEATLSPAHHAMELGHLSTACKCMAPHIETPICLLTSRHPFVCGLKVLHLWRHSQKIRTPQAKNFFSSAD